MKALPLIALVLLTGCSTRHAVLVNTGTVLGVQVAENPASGLYEARFGYARTEFAYVPSNRAGTTNETNYSGGAKDTADVLLELRMENIFKGGLVYQRLAVGENAVKQPGAAMLFSKSADGVLDPKVAEAVGASLKTIPAANSQGIDAKIPIAKAYEASPQKTKFDVVAMQEGYRNFADFLSNPTLTAAQTLAMQAALKLAGLLP